MNAMRKRLQRQLERTGKIGGGSARWWTLFGVVRLLHFQGENQAHSSVQLRLVVTLENEVTEENEVIEERRALQTDLSKHPGFARSSKADVVDGEDNTHGAREKKKSKTGDVSKSVLNKALIRRQRKMGDQFAGLRKVPVQERR